MWYIYGVEDDDMKHRIYTLSGKAILDCLKLNERVVRFSSDLILASNEYEDSALFYQLEECLKSEINSKDEDAFKQIYFYIDFNDAFPLKDRSLFDALFNDGFCLDFGGESLCFVALLSSQSQSKKRIFSFVRKDVFEPLNRRLNLDIDFEKNIYTKSLAYLTKLYAYRALYMSSSIKALRALDSDGESFFSSQNIIVLPEKKHNYEDGENAVRVFTAQQKNGLSESGEAQIEQFEAEVSVPITCFDGEGIISEKCRDIINSHLDKKMRGNSFQVRMPFLKGVLHTVNFHKFLRDKGVEGESAYVVDAFGIKRDIFKANVIIRPSVFKLCSLIEGVFEDGTDVMEYYFKKLREYNHGLYVVKTESTFKNTDFVRLSSQILSTLDLSDSDLDGIVKEHTEMADAFCPQNLCDPEVRQMLASVEDKSSWMELLLREPRFLDDTHIQSTISSYRVSRYNDIAMGRMLVRGENRFLSGDLIYFLVDLLQMVDGGSYKETAEELKKQRLRRGGVYMPGVAGKGQEVALIRSPHLSRNEDVCTVVRECNEDYHTYLKNLRGVIFVGDKSYIPSALGGADFDGDHISVIYDKRIIKACNRSGYTEIGKKDSKVPFIHIESLKGEGVIKKYGYVSPQAVYNTFSNRIGEISNAAMKIAAVEYDPSLQKADGTPSAALCTILTGNEIDATKKGVRPYIADATGFLGTCDEQASEVVREVEKYIKIKRELEGRGGEIPKATIDNDCAKIKLFDLSENEFSSNIGRNAVTQLLYRWAKAFVKFKSGKKQTLSKKALKSLEGIFGACEKNKKRDEIVSAFITALDEYERISKRKTFIKERLSDNSAKITVRLKGQYDDIYGGEQAYSDRFVRFQRGLHELCSGFSKEEIEALREALFAESEEGFDAEVFWPYSRAKKLSGKLFESIMELPDAELISNFDFEGYRLLYYALDSVLVALSDEEEPCGELTPLEENYLELCYKIAAENRSVSGFEKELAKRVVCNLKMAQFGTTEVDNTTLIRKIYPPKDAKGIDAFWKIFSINEVMAALGGEGDA
ncbi:MAG: hypothetical protein IIX89_00700 [Oscillospiraceae bacterium]|nr:hypothetical protein [Oscillospiraceae bacterium]